MWVLYSTFLYLCNLNLEDWGHYGISNRLNWHPLASISIFISCLILKSLLSSKLIWSMSSFEHSDPKVRIPFRNCWEKGAVHKGHHHFPKKNRWSKWSLSIFVGFPPFFSPFQDKILMWNFFTKSNPFGFIFQSLWHKSFRVL